MLIKGIELNKINDYSWEIPKTGNMKVPGRIYISKEMLQSDESNQEALKQVMNVAHLPGIQKYSLAMPDIHWGYGFPIGGVAAMDFNDGVISPGGVGYDINCGVRLATTSLNYDNVKSKLNDLIKNLFKDIPTGVGSHGAIQKLSKQELKKVAVNGSNWAIENDFGSETDLEFTEEKGKMINANPDVISDRAFERGQDQLGTLGSGNHFLEIEVVSEIYNEKIASAFGLFKGQITVLIHTGSRGFGYQICDDYLKMLINASEKYDFKLPDRQLASAPLNSNEGKNYLGAMASAANFAWCNRQIIMHLAHQTLKSTFSISDRELGLNLVYDVCHNIAKIEKYKIDGVEKKLCVHRKGATRAFPAGSLYIPEKYRNVGQPVLIPGDMGRYSFVCVGTQKAMDETFGSSCHGAGRLLSRTKALKIVKGRDLINELKERGVIIQAKGRDTIAEEMPMAYKDVINVVNVMSDSEITPKVAKLKPLGVIKG